MHFSFVSRIRAAAVVVTWALPMACGPSFQDEDARAHDTISVTSGTWGASNATCAEARILTSKDALIANFAHSASAAEQVLAYPIGEDTAPQYAVLDGVLRVTAQVRMQADRQYLGVVVAFEAGCVDASGFEGVEFSLGGSLTGCSLNFAAADAEHQDMASGPAAAEGPAGAFQPQAFIGNRMYAADDRTLRVPFQQQTGGNPSSPLDPSKLIFTLWQLDVPSGLNEERCVADLRIDDVRFYRTDE